MTWLFWLGLLLWLPFCLIGIGLATFILWAFAEAARLFKAMYFPDSR